MWPGKFGTGHLLQGWDGLRLGLKKVMSSDWLTKKGELQELQGNGMRACAKDRAEMALVILPNTSPLGHSGWDGNRHTWLCMPIPHLLLCDFRKKIPVFSLRFLLCKIGLMPDSPYCHLTVKRSARHIGQSVKGGCTLLDPNTSFLCQPLLPLFRLAGGGGQGAGHRDCTAASVFSNAAIYWLNYS